MSNKGQSAAKGAASRKGGQQERRRSGWKLLLILVVLGLGLAVLPTMLVVAVGMLPTLVAYIVDGRREKYAAFSVGCMNFCGVLPFMLQLWLRDHTFAHAWKIVGDPIVWMIMYGAAACGWLIYYAAPHVVAVYLRFQLERRIQKLRGYQKELVDEWGDSITRGVTPAVDTGGDGSVAPTPEEEKAAGG